MKYALFVILAMAGCQREDPPNTKPGGVQFRRSPDTIGISTLGNGHTTTYGMADPHPKMRYFDFSYEVHTKDGSSFAYGSLTISDYSFPSRRHLQDTIRKDNHLSKSKYQDIIIHPVFEFRDSTDFRNFNQ